MAPRAATITPEPPESSRIDKPGGDCTHAVLMRAITVRAGKANSAQLAELAEPPLSDGAVLIRARARGLRHRPRNRVGRVRLGPRRRGAAGAGPRVARH